MNWEQQYPQSPLFNKGGKNKHFGLLQHHHTSCFTLSYLQTFTILWNTGDGKHKGCAILAKKKKKISSFFGWQALCLSHCCTLICILSREVRCDHKLSLEIYVAMYRNTRCELADFKLSPCNWITQHWCEYQLRAGSQSPQLPVVNQPTTQLHTRSCLCNVSAIAVSSRPLWV